MSKKPSYSAQFKSDAVDLVITQGYRVAEAARNLRISASALRCWARDQQPDTQRDASSPEDLVTAQAENKALKKQLKRARPRPSLPTSQCKVYIYSSATGGVSCGYIM